MKTGLTKKLLLTFCLSAFAVLMSSSNESVARYPWPVAVKEHRVNSSFAEFRSSHFHAGLDIYTGERTDVPLIAVEDGYISRIERSAWNWGRVIAVKHVNGWESIFSHIESYGEKQSEFERVANEALSAKRKIEDVVIEFPPNKYRVRKGDIVGYSGESGVGDPHLHFDLRDAKGDYLNPLVYAFKEKDVSPPQLFSIILLPLDDKSRVNGDFQPVEIKLKYYKGKYVISAKDVPVVWGKTGVMVKGFDRINSNSGKLGIYSIELSANRERMYSVVFDKMPEKDFWNHGLVYDLYYNYFGSASSCYMLFSVEGNDLYFCRNNNPGDGILNSAKNGMWNMRINAKDIYGNESIVEFSMKADPNYSYGKNKKRTVSSGLVMTCRDVRGVLRFEINTGRVLESNPEVVVGSNGAVIEKINTIKTGEYKYISAYVPKPENAGMLNFTATATGENSNGVSLVAGFAEKRKESVIRSADGQAGVAYNAENLFSNYARSSVELFPVGKFGGLLSNPYRFKPEDAPFNGKVRIFFKVPQEYRTESGRIGVFRYSQGAWIYSGRIEDRDDNTISARVRHFSIYGLMVDSAHPVIRSLKPSGKLLYDRSPVFSFKISDAGTGVDVPKSVISVDVLEVDYDYDFDSKKVICGLDRSLLPGWHILKIKICDKAGNWSDEFTHKFKVESRRTKKR